MSGSIAINGLQPYDGCFSQLALRVLLYADKLN